MPAIVEKTEYVNAKSEAGSHIVSKMLLVAPKHRKICSRGQHECKAEHENDTGGILPRQRYVRTGTTCIAINKVSCLERVDAFLPVNVHRLKCETEQVNEHTGHNDQHPLGRILVLSLMLFPN